MSNLLPIAAAKVLRVPVIVFTSLQHFPIVPVVPSDAIIIGSCVHVAYNAAGFGGFYDVGTYVSNAVVLPKIMTDPLARRRDSRKRYREKIASQKVSQPPKKRGKKPNSASSQEENQKEAETEDADDSVVSQQDESLLDSSSADVTEQDASLEVSVEEGEASLDTSAVVDNTDEGVEAAANLIEMAYSEAGVNESSLEESIVEAPLKIAIVPGTEPEVDEDHTTFQASETELMSDEGAAAAEDVETHTIAEGVINESINGEEKESEVAVTEDRKSVV